MTKRGPTTLKHLDIDPATLPSSRKEAIAQKTQFFFSGRQCGRGHVAIRYASINNCIECHRLTSKGRAPLLEWTPDRVARKMLSAAKIRARLSGVDFGLTLDDVPAIPKSCPILGMELIIKPSHSNREHAPSLDRLDPNQGNVQIISYRANRIKNDATIEELILLGEWARLNG